MFQLNFNALLILKKLSKLHILPSKHKHSYTGSNSSHTFSQHIQFFRSYHTDFCRLTVDFLSTDYIQTLYRQRSCKCCHLCNSLMEDFQSNKQSLLQRVTSRLDHARTHMRAFIATLVPGPPNPDSFTYFLFG